MTTELLATLRRMFGTVSSVTESTGVVAVRNKTALKTLRIACEPYQATAEPITTGFPALVRVTETAKG